MKRQMMKRRESEWRRKEIKRLQVQREMMKKKRFNSENLQAICEAMQDEERRFQAMGDQQPGGAGYNDANNVEENKSDIEERKEERRPMTIKKHSNLLSPIAPNNGKSCGGGAPSQDQLLMQPRPKYASSMNVCAGMADLDHHHEKAGRRSSPQKKKMNLDAMGPKKGEQFGRGGGG